MNCVVLVSPRQDNHFTIMGSRENQQILTFGKLQPENVWHFVLIISARPQFQFYHYVHLFRQTDVCALLSVGGLLLSAACRWSDIAVDPWPPALHACMCVCVGEREREGETLSFATLCQLNSNWPEQNCNTKTISYRSSCINGRAETYHTEDNRGSWNSPGFRRQELFFTLTTFLSLTYFLKIALQNSRDS